MMDEARQEFAALVTQDPIPLARGALLIAKEEYPELDLEGYLGRLDELAREAEPWTAGEDNLARTQGLSRFLFEDQRFAGNRLSYGDPRNSFLNEVLDRKLGIPITLSLVYLEVGRRLGIRLEGVAFPGHFLVKAVDGGGEIIVDPFNQGVLLTREDLQARLQTAYGQPVHLGPAALRAASPRQILFRMLRNLKNIYTASSDWMRALAAMDRALLLEPRAVDTLLERAKLYEMLECFKAALEDLQAVIRIAPEHPAADALRDKIVYLMREVARIN
jgi:regulator of sirC expression with transglutaminase-like and TPR domain